MTLTLTMLRCPDRVAPETREIQGGEYSIGRGAENEWVLPDPERYLSKRHCVLAFRSGGWQIADLSTNGTFLNRDSEPIGQGARNLNDGDRLRMGAYEIEVRITAAQHFAPPARQPAAPANPFTLDPFAAPAGAPAFEPDPLLTGSAERDPFAASIGPAPINLPADYDPLAPEPHEHPFVGPTSSDHAPHLEDAFRPPRVVLPDDWDRDLLAAPFPAAVQTAANALAAPFAAPPPQAAQPLVAPPPQAAAPFAAPPPQAAQPLVAPPPQAAALFVAPPAQASPPFVAPPQALPHFSPVADPPTAAGPAPASPLSTTTTPPTRLVAAPPPAASAPSVPAPGADLLAAFLRGAGLEQARPADPAAAMETLGAALRAAVCGLRQTLIARAAIKSEFRIEQTMIRRSGNNPLKFSADDDDALSALVGAGRRTDMTAPEAITDALDDIRAHELATMAAMQQALRKLLAEFDPARLRQAGEKSALNFTSVQRKATAWDAFEALYARILEALSDDFDSVFGRAFAQAYERALEDVAEKEHAS